MTGNKKLSKEISARNGKGEKRRDNESCGHSKKSWVEGTGRWWTTEGAESILLLRSVFTSKDWDEYWQFPINLERSFYYHDALAEVGIDDGFDELGQTRQG